MTDAAANEPASDGTTVALSFVLADDSLLLRDGLCRLLEDEGHRVLADVGDGVELLQALSIELPDAVIVDVRMPPTHTDEGLRAALEIKARWPEVGVLVLSQYVEREYATELFAGNGCGIGYLLKDRVSDIGEFLDSLYRVARGGNAFDPEVIRQLLARTSHTDPLEALTRRERDVLGEMAQGRSNASIGERLFISQSAVEKNISSIFDKLGLSEAYGVSRRVLAVLRFLQG